MYYPKAESSKLVHQDDLFRRVIMVLLAVLMAFFVAFDKNVSGGRYIYLGIAIVIMVLGTKGKIVITIEPWYIFNILMILYTAVNSLWSWNSSGTIQMAYRQLVTFLCFIMIYIGYTSVFDNITPFLQSIKWGSWIVTAYMIYSFGIRTLIRMLGDGIRLAGDLGNINIFGMFIAFGVLANVFEIAIQKHFSLSSFLLIPEIFVIAATQSRKALLIVVIGVALSIFFYTSSKEHRFLSVIKLVIVSALFIFLLMWLSTLDIFAGITKRMGYLVNFVTGEGEIGSSANSRQEMIQIGWEQFLRTPLQGCGIASAKTMLIRYGCEPFDYLHNNYIELLTCGGAIGFGIYYARFIYLLWALIKYRKNSDDGTIPILIFIIVYLILEYARVSYYQKDCQILILVMFLQTCFQRNRSLNDEKEQMIVRESIKV